MVQYHRHHALSLPGGSFLAETARSVHGSAHPSLSQCQRLAPSHGAALTYGRSPQVPTARLSPAIGCTPVAPGSQHHRRHCEGISLGQWLWAVPRGSAPPCMAGKGTLGAALWLTAQEQGHFQDNWKVLLKGNKRKSCIFTSTGHPCGTHCPMSSLVSQCPVMVCLELSILQDNILCQ